MTSPAIQVRGLHKTFSAGLFGGQKVQALRGVNLQVEPGTVVAFVGPNGAGKTTTLHHLLGFLRPDRGEVQVFGGSPSDAQTRERLGFMPELFQTYPGMNGRQVLRFYGRLLGLDETTLDRRSKRLLTEVGLRDAADRKTGTYSKGMNQRLGLAHSLLGKPDLLVLDEPTTGLDPEGRKLIASIIRRQRAKGTTILLSSHILSDVESLCDRVAMIRSGGIVLDERIDTLLQGAQSYRIEIGSLPMKQAATLADGRAEFTVMDSGKLQGQVSTEAKNGLLKDLLGAGADVIRVESATSLEQLYMEQVQQEVSE